ncbi:MAG: hypothetical protein KDA37_00095 [Planctomycetales bacterium]|nr:hypothetical protein [Planctomycetales bacterium]
MLDEAFYARAFDRFEANYPELAVLAYVNGALAGYGNAVDERRAAKLLSSIESPPAMFMSQITSAYARAGARGQAPLPAGFAAQLRDWVVDRYAGLDDSSPYGVNLFSQVAAMLRQEADPGAFVRLLDGEVVRSGRRGVAHQTHYFQPNALWTLANARAGVQNFLTPPPFPPAVTQDFPASVLTQARFALHQPGSPYIAAQQAVYYVGTPRQAAPNWDDDTMRAAFREAKDPYLRLILLAGLDEESAERALEELLTADSASLDTLLAASGWAAARGEPEQAIESLKRARGLPMDKQMRGLLDAYLVGVSLELDSDADHAAAREAAVRLSHQTLQPQQATKLSAAMIQLGMDNEAAALDAKASSAAIASRGAPFAPQVTGQVLRTPRRTRQQDRIRQLLDRQQSEAAARLLSREILVEVRQLAQQQANWSYVRRKQKELTQRVKNYGLTKEVLASFDPGESDHHLKHGVYAMVLDALGKPDQAYKAYKRALELRPLEDEYRVKLILHEVGEGQLDRALARCSELHTHGEGLLTNQMLTVFQNREFSLAQQLNYAGLARRLLEHQIETGQSDVSWAAMFRYQVSSLLNAGNRRYPSLYSRSNGPLSRRDAGADRDQTEAYHKRRALHDELCRTMLNAPSIATSGFAGLLAAHEAVGEPTDAFKQLAREILMRKDGPRAALGRYGGYSSRTADSDDLVAQRTPEEYFVRACWEAGDLAPVKEEVLAHLQKTRRTDSLALVQGYYELYTCSSDEFLEAAGRFIRENASLSVVGMQLPYTEMVVHQVWEDRGLDISVDSLMLTSLKDWMNNPTGSSPPPYLLAYLKSLVKREGTQEAADWLEQIATVMVGPLDKRSERIAAHYQPNTWSTGTPNAAMHQFASFVNLAARNSDLFVPTLRFLSNGQVAPLVPNLDSTIQGGVRKALTNDADEAIAFLDELGLLGDAPDYELRAYGLNQGQSTLLLTVGAQLRSHRQKAQIEKMLDERGDLLGPRLLRCAMSLNPQKFRELLGFVGRRIDHFRSLDEPLQRAIGRELDALVVAINMSSSEDLSTLQGELREAMDWVQEQNAARGQQLVSRIESAKRFEDLGVAPNSLDQWLSKELAGVAAADPAAAASAYFRIAELYDEAAARNAVNRRYYPSTAQGLANSLLQRLPYNSPEKANLCIALAEHDGDQLIGRRYELEQGLSGVRQQYSTIYGRSRQENHDARWRVDQFLSWTRDKIARHESMLLLMPFVQAVESQGVNDLAEIDRYLTEQQRDAAAENLRTAVRYVSQRHHRRKPDQTPDLSAYEAVSAMLSDRDSPLTSRIAIGQFFCERERDSLPLATRRALLGILREVAESQAPLQQYEHRVYMNNLAWLAERRHFPEDLASTVDAWVQRYVNSTRRLPAAYGSTAGQLDSPNDAAAEAQMLAVCYRLDRPRDARRLLLRYNKELSQRQETIAVLTRAGELDKAASLGRTSWRQFSPFELSPPPVRFDQQLAENLDKLVEKLGEGPQSLIVEAALKRLPDSEQPQPAGFVGREQRMTALADRFDAKKLSPAGASALFLSMLRDSDPAFEKLAEVVQREVDAVNLEKLAMVNSPQLDAAGELMAAHAQWKIKRGDPSSAMRLFVEVVKGSPRSRRNNYYYRLTNILNRHTHRLCAALKENAGQFDQEGWAAISRGLRECFQTDSYASVYNNTDLVTLLVVAESHSGKLDEFAAWTKNIPSRFKKQIQRSGLSYQAWAYAFADVKDDQENAAIERAQRAARVLDRMKAFGMIEDNDFSSVSMRINHGPRDFTDLQRELNANDLEAALQAASAAAERPELVWLLYASTLNHRGKPNEAVEAWRHAFEATPANNRDTRFAIRAEQLDTLIRSNQRQEAAKLWEETPADLIPTRLKGRYDKIKRSLEQDDADKSDDKLAA